MRVLMVSDVYFPRVNGVSTSIETFRRSLEKIGVEVRLVVPKYADEANEPGIIRVAAAPAAPPPSRCRSPSYNPCSARSPTRSARCAR